ncbi:MULTISPECIES: alpha/beta fold hydrolase [Comamonas]|jgi:pimeloyl-ACP methyl ester carboxylesterase|uniref:Alpha/beta hydrolase n=1 Tax=Comamonas terrigena TaxID=32013 RepID=A0A2A7UVM3_COMTR|nr:MULTISPECIES: alpha/beta hydrolase [Comamonas]MBD9530577.1 alpha/beta hydrolase [Comamonas sp. CMM01]PEH89241.1 alpha/beta hydrolase [Comamonas terrigena]BBL24368.1 hydrolase [Comamonas terrigena NBRC 13299]SUY72036.1 Tropinesterase [Comamonas terrigena]
MYQPQRAATSQHLPVRTLSYHVRTWGQPQPDSVPLVLVHGWMDVSASWQFVVDAFSQAFAQGRQIIAPDWRGFGLSPMPAPCDNYHYADYLGDLDALLRHCVPGDGAIDLVGHSMGGNVAMFYAGARPARIRRLVNLEGFGMPASRPAQAPRRTAQWLDELRKLESGAIALKTYASVDEVAQRLRKTNPRLPADKALWLAQHWSAPQADGSWAILGDAAHKIVNPQLFRVDEALAHYAAITAPLLAVEASDDSLAGWWKERYTLAEYHQRLQAVPDCRLARVEDAGHMLHHDQPAAVARLIEDFCTAAA